MMISSIFISGTSSCLGKTFLRLMPHDQKLNVFCLGYNINKTEDDVQKIDPPWNITFIPLPDKDLTPLYWHQLHQDLSQKTSCLDVYIDFLSCESLHMPVAHLLMDDVKAVFEKNMFLPLNILQGALPLIRHKNAQIIAPRYTDIPTAYCSPFLAAHHAYHTFLAALVQEHEHIPICCKTPACPILDISLYQSIYPGKTLPPVTSWVQQLCAYLWPSS